MLIDFRQGLVRAPANFLMKNGTAVSLQVPPSDTVIAAIADGTADYLISEKQTIVNAWPGPFVAGTDYWLYWDIHLVTGARSFGHTKLEPFEGPTPPHTPQADQHWFDTSTKLMKVYNATTNRWTRVIRVFACHYSQGGVLIGMGANSGFTGTQAGLNGQTNAGALLFDNLGGVLKKKDGTYFTTEDYALTGIAQSSQVKFGSMQIRAEAGIYMPALTLVQFVDYNRVVPASIHVIDKVNYGVIEFDANVGDVVNVTVDGVIRSGTWNFPAMGVPMNAPIYIDANGVLTPYPSTPPVPIGTVIDKDAILLRPSSLFMGDNASEPGPQGEIGYTGSAGAAFSKINGEAGSIVKGMAVYIPEAAPTTCLKSTATSYAASCVSGVVNDPVGLPGVSTTLTSKGIVENTTTDWDIITGETGGLRAGKDYFLRTNSFGGISSTPPFGDGLFIVKVGKALSATALDVNIEPPIEL